MNTRILLHDLPLLERLSAPTIEALQATATCCMLAAGEYLYRQGDPASSLYIVVEGGIRLVELTREGQNVHLKVYSRGDLFGVLAVSDTSPHPSGAQAIADSMVAAISGIAMRQLILAYPEVGLFIVDHLVSHVQTSHGRIRQLAAERVERRLARTLVHFAAKFGTTINQVISIDVPLSQKDLADFVGTTPETVNRILKSWDAQQVLRCSRQHIDILDLAWLEQSSEDPVYLGQKF